MKQIRSVKDLPDWFNIEKYTDSRHLNAKGWYSNLAVRGMARAFLSSDIPNDELLNELLPSLWENPIATAQFANNLKISFPAISPLTIEHGANITDNFFAEKPIVDSQSYNDVFPDHNQEFICVNLMATDSMLIQGFTEWLEEIRSKRQHIGHIRCREYTASDFKRWASHQILAYIDLTLWAEAIGVSINQQVLGLALFPIDYESDLASKIRNTIAPIANELMSGRTHNALAIQAGLEE